MVNNSLQYFEGIFDLCLFLANKSKIEDNKRVCYDLIIRLLASIYARMNQLTKPSIEGPFILSSKFTPQVCIDIYIYINILYLYLIVYMNVDCRKTVFNFTSRMVFKLK